MKQAVTLLKKHSLRITPSRNEIVGVFIKHGYALSQPEIERALGEKFDRVTIYRTLTSFLESGLIHKVLDDSGASRYALCTHSEEESEAHSDEHIHFKCLECGNTLCLEDLVFPHFKAPKGYDFVSTNVLIEGRCPKCSV